MKGISKQWSAVLDPKKKILVNSAEIKDAGSRPI
jgi:hypothetical protein